MAAPLVQLDSRRNMLISPQVVISDYPAPVVLTNIRRNAKGAVPGELEDRCQVEGHEWGELSGSLE